MAQRRSAGRPVAARRAMRSTPAARRTSGSGGVAGPAAAVSSLLASTTSLDAARRVGESLAIAVVTSSGLYLVGTVYTDAYYGRLSIEATSLDLAPTYVTLQAAHALPALLEYPSTLLLLYVLYRSFNRPAQRVRAWFDRARRRFPRLLVVLANVLIVAPLVVGAALIGLREQTLVPGTLLSEIAGLLENLALILLVYAIWLGWSQRTSLVAQVRQRKLLPIALLAIVYLLTALAGTAATAERAAAVLLTGNSDTSLAVRLTMADGTDRQLAGKDLLLVAVRNGNFFVVERQPAPPSQRPVAYVVPAAAVDVARVQRLVDADASFDDFDVEGIE